jgi:hypothetical protein
MRRGLVGNIYVIKTIYLICVHDLMTDLRPDLADDEIDRRELFAVQEVFSSSPSLVLELAVQPKRQGALQSEIVVRNSGLEDSRLSFQRQSLKSFRRVEMAQVWREGLGFERNK